MIFILTSRIQENMIRAALQDVRRIIYDLRPMALEEMGLVPTIKKYLRRMEGQGKLAIRFRKIGNERRLPEKLEAAIFRIVQEAVQNVVKHSQATEAKVRLEYAREWISLLVRDNGQGFDLNEKKDGAFGLLGMQERVEVLNGTFSIDSGKGRGTAVFIQIPVHV